MKATAFQEATIDAALACFDRTDGPRRYLVADEVGMGKTVVARGVIGRMIARNKGVPLNVLYVCSNLAVARQNRDNLLRGDFLTEDQRRRACVPVDRLGVVIRADDTLRSSSSPLRLFTLTPGTSLPDWKDGRTGTGTMYERATAQALLEHAFGRPLAVDALQFAKSRSWANHLAEARAHFRRRKLAPELAERFRAQVSALIQRPAEEIPDWLEASALLRPHPRRPLFNGLRPKLGAFRAACCLLALELIRPDLVIFDEFQRFPEIVSVRPSLSPHKNALVSALRSDTGPSRTALLLLSATPYRMYAGAGEGDTHEEFLAVTRFLLGGSVERQELRERAGEQITALSGALAGLARAFNSQVVDGDAIASRNTAERVLRSVMARTERSDGEEAAVPLATTGATPTGASIEREKLRPVDLLVFKHMVDLRRRNRGRSGADVAFWQSIPLPTQSMYGYKSAVILRDPKDPKPPAEAFLTTKARDELRTSAVEAHPRMRALVKACRPADLCLPWVAPSNSLVAAQGRLERWRPPEGPCIQPFRRRTSHRPSPAFPRGRGRCLSWHDAARTASRCLRRRRPQAWDAGVVPTGALPRDPGQPPGFPRRPKVRGGGDRGRRHDDPDRGVAENAEGTTRCDRPRPGAQSRPPVAASAWDAAVQISR